MGAFWINVIFPLVVHSHTSTSYRHLFISISSLLWMMANFLKQNPCISTCPGVFQFYFIFLILFRVNLYVFFLLVLLRVLLICNVAYPFGFLLMFSWFPYFTPKLFSFLCISLLGCLRTVWPYLLIEFSFIVLECPVLSVLFPPLSISFLIFLLTPVLSRLFSQIVLLFFLFYRFLFLQTYFSIFFYHFCLFS